MPVPSAAAPVDYDRVINAVRLELAEAGNPAFTIVIVDADGEVHLAPMVFSAVGPVGDHARRMAAQVQPGETLLIVSRQASGRRQAFDILDPGTLRRLHRQDEVIEASFVETDGPI